MTKMAHGNSELKQVFLNTISQIPYGKVATYGQIAQYAGAPGAARAVGRSLKGLPKDTQIPWHRVLNARGEISIPHSGANIQRRRLESEGVLLLRGKVKLRDYAWRP